MHTCKPQGHHTGLVPKQIINVHTLVETYIYVIHFSRLYLYLSFLYRSYYFQTTPSYLIAISRNRESVANPPRGKYSRATAEISRTLVILVFKGVLMQQAYNTNFWNFEFRSGVKLIRLVGRLPNDSPVKCRVYMQVGLRPYRVVLEEKLYNAFTARNSL